jgi:hypothetical protein
MRRVLTLAALTLAISAVFADGYTDTAFLPDGKWRVHDANRPRPPKVDPGPGPRKPVPAPKDAIVLFDGKSLDNWKNLNWKLEGGAMVAQRGEQRSKAEFGDCHLHIEWSEPTDIKGQGQGRGNSGVFLMGMFEVQVLDSFGTETYADGQAASLYGQCPPRVNATRKPGDWNVYDIYFRAPRSADGKVTEPAKITVVHNGFIVQNNVSLLGPTQHRNLASYTGALPNKGPIALQDHGNPVRFRNIWVVPLPPAE